VTSVISVGADEQLGHFGEARWFVLVEVDSSSRAILCSRVVEAPPHEPGSFPRWLREQGVQVLITAGIEQRALDNLHHHGIEVDGATRWRTGVIGCCMAKRTAHRDDKWLRSPTQ
jgi:predicted Fe-Mo cluster-binding NifX family protein